jgi:membrane associated rhomboid family serine protease
MKAKIQLIFIPFVIVLIALVGGYTLAHWLLILALGMLPVNDIFINFFIPVIIVVAVVLLFFRSRLKILSFEKEASRRRTVYGLLLIAAISIPICIAQNYLETATGKLSLLRDSTEFTKHPPTKYYELKHFYIDSVHYGAFASFGTSGRTDSSFDMTIFVVQSIRKSQDDSIDTYNPVWLGKKYYKSIPNSWSQDRKQQAYISFAKLTELEFHHTDFSHFTYLERCRDTDDKNFGKAINHNKKYDSGGTVLLPVNEPFEKRSGNMPLTLFLSIMGGIAGIFLLLLIPKAQQQEVPGAVSSKPGKVGKSAVEGLSMFIPVKDFFITPLLVDLNLFIFVLMVICGLGFISFEPQALYTWGGNYGPAIRNGEWWRLLTNIFLHGGFMHVASNMVALIFSGVFLEKRIGWKRFLMVYLVTGVVASFTSACWHGATVGVGASGAIFGTFGFLLALLVTGVYPREQSKSMLTTIGIYVGYNLLIGLTGNIDNAAHIGGLASGFLIGLLMSGMLKDEDQNE